MRLLARFKPRLNDTFDAVRDRTPQLIPMRASATPPTTGADAGRLGGSADEGHQPPADGGHHVSEIVKEIQLVAH